MAVSNNPWGSWNQDLSEAVTFTTQMSQEASTDLQQLQQLAAEAQAGTLSPAAYQAAVISLNNKVSADESSIESAASGILSNPLASNELSSFCSAWTTTIASTGIGIPNPVGYNPDGPSPLLQETVNADGTVSISFVVSYYHNGFGSRYGVGLNCGCADDGPGLGWMPDDGDGDFGDYLTDADNNGSAQYSWYPNGQEVDMNIVKNGDGTFTITATMSAATAASYTSTDPNFSSLESFVTSYPV